MTLPPRTDLSMAVTPNNKSYKTFLIRRLYSFYFRQCFTILFKFSSVFVILFFSPFNGFFSSIKMKIGKNFPVLITSNVNTFQSQRFPKRYGAGKDTWIQSWSLTNTMLVTVFLILISTRKSPGAS